MPSGLDSDSISLAASCKFVKKKKVNLLRSWSQETCLEKRMQEQKKKVAFFINVSFFHASMPLNNALVDAPDIIQNIKLVIFFSDDKNT